jgi:hypothetical protein
MAAVLGVILQAYLASHGMWCSMRRRADCYDTDSTLVNPSTDSDQVERGTVLTGASHTARH